MDPRTLFSMVLAIVFSFPVYKIVTAKLGVGEIITAKTPVLVGYYVLVFALFIFALLYMVGNAGQDPFIYFRF